MKKFRALVVDDSSTIRKIIKANLNKLGITTVYEAANGHDGFKIAVSMPLDIVFTDYNMPEMNGLEMTVKLRADQRTAQLKIIAISSEFDNVLMEKFKEVDVYDFIEKPFDLAKFNNAIKPVLVKDGEHEDSDTGAKLTSEMVTRLFSQAPHVDFDEKHIFFVFGNEKVKLAIDRFTTHASYYIDIPEGQ